MKISSRPPQLISKAPVTIILLVIFLALSGCGGPPEKYAVYEKAATFAGIPKEQRGAVIKEPFGLAFDKKGNLFISDGEAGKIWQADKAGTLKVVTDKLDTPSGIAFDKTGDLYAADPGSHTIKKINVTSGEVSIIAGVENQPGFLDGDAQAALFNAPIGIAVGEDGKIFVADTYNDRIRVIESGKVSTVAGSGQGLADADIGLQAKFDTPCGIAVTKDGGLLVADTGNARLRSIDKFGKVSTLAGGGGTDTDTGQSTLPLDASFAEPLDVKINGRGDIYIADASANTIYVLKQGESPTVEKLLPGKRGLADGPLEQAAFIRPAGIALDTGGNLFIADSENQLVRVLQDKDGKLGATINSEDAGKLKPTADEMRGAARPAGHTIRRTARGKLPEHLARSGEMSILTSRSGFITVWISPAAMARLPGSSVRKKFYGRCRRSFLIPYGRIYGCRPWAIFICGWDAINLTSPFPIRVFFLVLTRAGR